MGGTREYLTTTTTLFLFTYNMSMLLIFLQPFWVSCNLLMTSRMTSQDNWHVNFLKNQLKKRGEREVILNWIYLGN